MNTWGYLILITALLLLAGVMLYARFASRSREKSLHHPPVEWVFLPEAISAAPSPERLPELSLKDESHAEPSVRLDRVAASKEVSSDRGYFDELQEAAAGLAKLMRSSPVSRTEPVVFAPEIEAVDIVDVVTESDADLETVMVEEEMELAAETFISLEAPLEELIVEEPVLEVPVRVLSLREIVGESVADQFARLDEGLDELEALVSGIAASLRALGELERSEFEALSEGLVEEAVAEAA